MPRKPDTGRKPSMRAVREAERVAALHPDAQRTHPSALPADAALLGHVNTCGALPEFYIDRPFRCRDCGCWQIWRAADQKWYYEQARGHIDATAIRCHPCRLARKRSGETPG